MTTGLCCCCCYRRRISLRCIVHPPFSTEKESTARPYYSEPLNHHPSFPAPSLRVIRTRCVIMYWLCAAKRATLDSEILYSRRSATFARLYSLRAHHLLYLVCSSVLGLYVSCVFYHLKIIHEKFNTHLILY